MDSWYLPIRKFDLIVIAGDFSMFNELLGMQECMHLIICAVLDQLFNTPMIYPKYVTPIQMKVISNSGIWRNMACFDM